MRVIACLLGFGYIAFSFCSILYTEKTSEAIKRLFQNHRLKYVSILPAVVGILFLISAPAIIYPWLFQIIGFLIIIGAILTFTDPKQLFSKSLNWYLNAPDQIQRLYGIIGIIFGTLVLSWIK